MMKLRNSFIFIVIALILSLGCDNGGVVDSPDSILTLGHGVYYGSDGKPFVPDTEFTLMLQEKYIEELSNLRQAKQLPVSNISKLIYELVPDPVIANALFLDWLIENTKPENEAVITLHNSALRWDYISRFKPDLMPKNNRFGKGVDPAVARKLEDAGISVYYLTNSGGSKYISECRAAGVPIPPAMYTSAWKNEGVFANEFISGSSQADLWSYSSTSPSGVCLSLPRYESIGGGAFSNEASLFGLICLGIQSSKACFWDNPRGVTFTKGDPVEITDLVGGVDLVANGQGTCSDCHSGENPYVVHPEKSAFASLPSLQPLAWYAPLVDASWPQNPGPTNLLSGVASTGKCDSCHRVGSAGRFPELSQQLSGYCGVVLEIAKGTSTKATMPPFGLARNDFLPHITALEKACKAPSTSGEIVGTGGLGDDPGFISPPIVIDPLYGCATQVAVRGGILDAKIRLSINSIEVAAVNVRDPDMETLNVPDLTVGDVVTATQEHGGTTSANSIAITVRDHQVDFPAGLPAPDIDPGLIYECGNSVAVRHVPGAKITVYSNGSDPRSRSTSTGWSAITPDTNPFSIGDTFTAEISLCEDTSPLSTGQSAVAEPSTIPAPTFNPPAIFAGQELVTVETLLNGSKTTVAEANFGVLSSFSTPISWYPNYDVATKLNRPLSTGDQLLASQTLCSSGPEIVTPRAQDCQELPPPRIRTPIVGETYVVVIDKIPGARIHVYDAANIEIGDGSGNIITLSRTLVAGDVVTVVQQVGECTSQNGYQVSVVGKPSEK